MNRTGIQPRETLLALSLMLAASTTLAQDSGWYGGLAGGRSWTDIQNHVVSATIQTSGSTVNTFNADQDDNTFNILGGYSFSKNIALEASWFDLGEFGFNSSLLPAAQFGSKTEMQGYGVDVVGTWPISQSLSFLARLGINNTQVEQRFSSTLGGRFANGSDRDVNETYGVGLQWAVNDRVNLRTELTQFGIDDFAGIADDNARAFTVGINYRFGVKPAPVVVAPEPQPEPEPEPKPLMEVTLGAEALFDFDKSELKPEGRTRLDQLLRDMNGVDYDMVIVTGHTDRIGTRNYNIALSNRRAAAVRDYLVQGGVPAANITARGMNSDEPVTTPAQCAGRRGQDLIACYQPDRRVVISVHGTRPAGE